MRSERALAGLLLHAESPFQSAESNSVLVLYSTVNWSEVSCLTVPSSSVTVTVTLGLSAKATLNSLKRGSSFWKLL